MLNSVSCNLHARLKFRKIRLFNFVVAYLYLLLDDYVCAEYEFQSQDKLTYDCDVNNICATLYFYIGLLVQRFPGKTGPSSYVQCSYYGDECTNMNCTNNRKFIPSNCTCV